MIHQLLFLRPSAHQVFVLTGLFSTVVLSACGGGSATNPAEVVVYRATASLQCGPNLTTQENLNSAVAALRSAGVTVNTASCGNTGNPSPAVCGIWNGDVWVVSVPEQSLSTAHAMGFGEAPELPNLKTMSCRAGGA
jgi:hypothetical protein